MEHLLANKLTNDSQLGFRPGRSCTTNLLTYLEQATAAKDREKSMDTVHLDLAKLSVKYLIGGY